MSSYLNFIHFFLLLPSIHSAQIFHIKSHLLWLSGHNPSLYWQAFNLKHLPEVLIRISFIGHVKGSAGQSTT